MLRWLPNQVGNERVRTGSIEHDLVAQKSFNGLILARIFADCFSYEARKSDREEDRRTSLVLNRHITLPYKAGG